jgi:hypothetical protein
MRPMAGVSRRRISLSSIESATASLGGGLLFCCATGSIAVAIDVAFHLSLRLPGHHGLTQMALLIMARCVTRRSWAATMSATTSAAIASVPFMGFSPTAPLLYLLSGLVIDGVCLMCWAWRDRIWFLGAVAGLGNGVKSIELWLLGDIARGHGVLLINGLAYSLLSHVAFGLAGGLIAAQLWSWTNKLRRTDQ